jgi:hypothetical protein
MRCLSKPTVLVSTQRRLMADGHSVVVTDNTPSSMTPGPELNSWQHLTLDEATGTTMSKTVLLSTPRRLVTIGHPVADMDPY